MPSSAARSSARELARKSAKQTATRSRTRTGQRDSIPNVSRSSEDGLNGDVVHDAMEPTKLQTPASPPAIFAPTSHSGTHEHPNENLRSTISVPEDPDQRLTQTETSQAEPGNSFPGGPLSWEWDGSEDFQGIAQNYEPQGELLNEPGGRRSLEHDFDFRGASTDSPQIQSYFSEQFRGFPFEHPQIPEQSLLRQQAQTIASGQNALYTIGDKRKSVAATESDPSGTAGGDLATKRVAFSPEEPGAAATEHAAANFQAPQHHVFRRASEGPEPDRSRADAFRTKSAAQQEPPVKRSYPSNRRDRSGEKKMALPAGKVFPIQIGSELFRLSGASISSDGKPVKPFWNLEMKMLKLQKLPPTSQISLENSYGRRKIALPVSKLCISIEIPLRFETFVCTSKVRKDSKEKNFLKYLTCIRVSCTAPRWGAFCQALC